MSGSPNPLQPTTGPNFDLTPDPRVLQMLGEIELQQWRCLAELVDNSVDGFLNAERSGNPIDNPEVLISVPRADTPAARITVRDNGPGMSGDTLEKAVKAGWTGNSPLINLGLFGMGFNIATARLGLVTEVWTSRAGDPVEVGVRIDFEDLRSKRSFSVPRVTRPKMDPAAHGTEIVITKLKPDQRLWFTRGANTSTVRRHMAKAYSALLSPESGPAKFRLELNGTRIQARRHCIWSPERLVDTPNGHVSVVERFNVALPPRRFCLTCMATLPESAVNCPTASASCSVVAIERRVHGWVGLQRYLHDTDYGIDLIRNGRKIELSNQDLFLWQAGDNAESEYPIDDQRKRGRFVGEIHIDHCRVSYTKNRFERDDPAWEEMVRIVRGEGPLQPQKAKSLGFGTNTSPLFRLFQAFRRTSPQGKNGLWSRIFVVKDNDRAIEMADRFQDNDPEYLDDEKWWQLVQEQDGAVIGGADPTSPGGPAPPPADIPPGFFDDPPAAPAPSAGGPTGSPQPPAPPPIAARRPIFELTRKYIHPTYRVEYDVQAFAVDPNDSDLGPRHPWAFKLTDVATRTYAFCVDTSHDLYRSTTMTPLDALLTELSFRTGEFLKQTAPEATLPSILADFRREYCVDSRLDAAAIITEASAVLMQIAQSLTVNLPNEQGRTLYDGLTEPEKIYIGRKMVARGITPAEAIASGAFLAHAEPQTLRAFLAAHPELFFDGKYWEDAYATLDYGTPAMTEEARQLVSSRFDGYMADAVWLAGQTPSDLDRVGRDALIRATLSLRLLQPDSAE
jgi:hypothetical protein